MINLILGGGLGNQMFQYAFARNLSNKTGQKICFNTYLFNKKINIDRNFSLNHFSIPTILFCDSKKSENDFNYFFKFMKIVKYLKYILPNSLLCKLINRKKIYYSVNGPFKFYPYYHNKSNKDIYIHGGFQSFKYFEEIQEIIHKEFSFSNKINKKNLDIINLMENRDSVCVHIRRGDYLSPEFKDSLNVCTDQYYKSAIKYIKEKTTAPKFFIFSNSHEDIEWIKANYKFLPEDTFFVDLNNPDYEELQIMTFCKHFIISNSSFSWWAQFLSKHTQKIVIAPSIWDKRKKCDYKDIYLPHFIKIDTEGCLI